MVADGKTPWCLGIFAFDATGWPATDWLETVLLLDEGPDFYDRWVGHDVPFDHPAAVAALRKWAHWSIHLDTRCRGSSRRPDGMRLCSLHPKILPNVG